MNLNVAEWGDADGFPVVCVHGVRSHALRFEMLAENGLADRFHDVSVDLRGHGYSGWEPPCAAYREALGDLLEVVVVPGSHLVLFDAFEETADAVELFLD